MTIMVTKAVADSIGEGTRSLVSTTKCLGRSSTSVTISLLQKVLQTCKGAAQLTKLSIARESHPVQLFRALQGAHQGS